jgi:hypothetical protein
MVQDHSSKKEVGSFSTATTRVSMQAISTDPVVLSCCPATEQLERVRDQMVCAQSGSATNIYTSSQCCQAARGVALITHYPTPSAVLVHFNDTFVVSCISSLGRHEPGKRVVVSMAGVAARVAAKPCKHRPHATVSPLQPRPPCLRVVPPMSFSKTMKIRFQGKLLFAVTD